MQSLIERLPPIGMATLLALLIHASCVRGSLAQDASRTPELQAELDQLAKDFNTMYHGRTPTVVVLDGKRVWQKQTFLGLYEKTPEGDYLQRNTCETGPNSSFGPAGTDDGEQRLTIENGRIVIYATYKPKNSPAWSGPPAGVERLGNGIIFRDITGVGVGGWASNDFFITRSGRHGSLRTFKGQPENDDLFVEIAAAAP